MDWFAELVLCNEPVRQLGLLEKAIVKDHGRFDAGCVSMVEELLGFGEIILGHGGLPLLCHQGLFKKRRRGLWVSNSRQSHTGPSLR
ncbi:MAG: hypothetical protein R2932_48285 [Caldilineaceae bacterium]